MRSFDDPRGVGFLLSLITLPLAACPSDDGDATASADDDSTGADDDGTTMTDPSVTMTADDSGSSGPSTVADSTESSGPDPTTPTEGDSGSSGDATGSESSTGGESLCPEDAAIPQVCTDFAEHTVVCQPDYAGERPMIAHECTCYLEYYAPSYGESCGTAVEEYYACLVTADCEEIASEMACVDERMVVDMECV